MSLKNLKHQFGFSLPELMIAMGLLGGVSLVTMKLIDDQMGNEAFIRANGDISKTVSLIEGLLNNPEKCLQMLGGKTKGTGTTTGTVISELQYEIMQQGTNTVQVIEILKAGVGGEKNYQYFSIPNDGIQLASNPSFSGTSQDAAVADLILRFRIKRKSLFQWGAKSDTSSDHEVVKRITVVASVDSANIVQSCGPAIAAASLDAQEKFCNSLGNMATWDAGAIPPRCVLRSLDCDWNFMPRRVSDGLVPQCVTVKTVIPATNLFDVGSTCTVGPGGVQVVNDGSGRFRLNCP